MHFLCRKRNCKTDLHNLWLGTYNYHLSKFLTDLLDPIIPTSRCKKDSFTFCEEIKKVSAANRFLISYGVCSLFTNIPLNETIDIAVNLLFEHNPSLNITKAELKRLFEFDGVATGSPLGPVLANLFTLWLNSFGECEIILYRRYILYFNFYFNFM